MMGITVKIDLAEANTMRRALEEYRAMLLERITRAGGIANSPGTAAEVGRAETLLRRDFSWTSK